MTTGSSSRTRCSTTGVRSPERLAAARAPQVAPCAPPGACARDARARRAHRLRVEQALAALGRHAAARLDRTRALLRPRAPAHGRALRRAGRDDARAAQHGASPDLGQGGQHHRLRDPLDPRGGLPLDAGRRDVGPARAHRRRDRRRPPAAARVDDARRAALLRARHRGARGARRGRRARLGEKAAAAAEELY